MTLEDVIKFVSIRVIVVFSHLESDAERTRCDQAMQNVKLQKADFANKYFYIFGLNLKFCKGIRNYKAKLSEEQLIEQKRLHISFLIFITTIPLAYLYYFDMWLNSKCTKKVESKIWSEIQGNLTHTI